ncbi:uncharacterized protein LOC131943375 [Physella acuta]|uniref:uncharacterized protein LOC131943375 n=1 Tax=Physella acuta TaxID=109671 RepID=UPI0027DEA7F6|nr:uncharacterized protein LOC131943375 [Physella acuta]
MSISGNQYQSYEENEQISECCATWCIEEVVRWESSDVPGSKERFAACSCFDHAYFIPIQHLTEEHMFGKHKDLKLALVHAVAGLTVRGEFPPAYDGYGVLMPTPQPRTGFITGVKKRKSTCPCNSCQTTPSDASRDWFEITIETEDWLVSGRQDVIMTDCIWKLEEESATAVVLTGMEIKNQQKSSDYNGASSLHCEVVCVTHDQEIGVRVAEAKRHERKMRKKFQRTLPQDKFVFFVSYPHGNIQQVTIGKLMEKEGPVSEFERCAFSSGICPGCLGAPVFIRDMTDGISSPRVLYCLRGVRKLSFTPSLWIETIQANS